MEVTSMIEETIYENYFASAYQKSRRAGLDNRAAVAASELAGEQAVEAYRAKLRLAAAERAAKP